MFKLTDFLSSFLLSALLNFHPQAQMKIIIHHLLEYLNLQILLLKIFELLPH